MKYKNRILILYQRNWGIKFGQYIIDRIHEDMPGSAIGVITVKELAEEYFIKSNTDGSVQFHRFFDPVRDFPEQYVETDTSSIAEICKNLEIDSIWEILQATRNHIKNYRRCYNYGFSPSLNDEELSITIKAYYKFIMEIDNEFRPDFIVLPNPVETFNILLEQYAHVKNIPVRSICLTPVKGYYQWVKTRTYGGGKIEEKYRSGEDAPEFHKEASDYISRFREEFIIPENAYPDTTNFMKYGIRDYIRLLHQCMLAIKLRKPLPKGIHQDHARYSIKLLIRDFFLKKRYYNKVKKYSYDEMPNNRFVYFPLQMQPELAIDTLAPYFTNQIETARLAAMSLPSDYTLVVKDHPVMVGKRNPKYLKRIQSLPNVKLINYSVKTPEILKRADGVIVTTGSVVIEATLYGLPVVQLGNLSYSFLFPNVHHITDMTELNKFWRKILGHKYNDESFEKGLVRFISLVMKYGIKTNYYEMWENHARGEMEPIWQGLKQEIDSCCLN